MRMTMPPDKTFSGDFDRIREMLETGENFAFSRFSDGEVFMMQGQEIVMAADHSKVKGRVHHVRFAPDDHKHFNPAEHEFYRQALEDAFTHRQKNYFKGVSCRCCIGGKDFNWQMDLISRGYDDLDQEHLTWSNLLINANYLNFLNIMLTSIRNRSIILIVNKNADLEHQMSGLFDIKKDFRIGPNCIVNDYGIIEEIDNYIDSNKIENHLFLFAASSLSNMAIHKLYSKHPNNTYMDIGSSLNPLMKGIGSRRNYMRQLDTGTVSYKPCIW